MDCKLSPEGRETVVRSVKRAHGGPKRSKNKPKPDRSAEETYRLAQELTAQELLRRVETKQARAKLTINELKAIAQACKDNLVGLATEEALTPARDRILVKTKGGLDISPESGGDY